jgi:hypothetical protein
MNAKIIRKSGDVSGMLINENTPKIAYRYVKSGRTSRNNRTKCYIFALIKNISTFSIRV